MDNINTNNTLNESAALTGLVTFFTSKEVLMAAGGAGALSVIMSYVKGSSGNIQRRFRKMSKLLVKLQLQFGGKDGLSLNKVLPGNKFLDKKDKGSFGIIPFVNQYIAEVSKDLQYIEGEFDSKINSAQENNTKAEICYAALSSFCNKYFNEAVVNNKLIAKAQEKEQSQDQYLINSYQKIIEQMKKTQSNQGSISPFYSRAYKNYMNMVNRYISICNSIVNNFKKYTVIDTDKSETSQEKQSNELEVAVQKFGAAIDKQKDLYEANFYRVINEIISSEDYIKLTDLMLNKVIPQYKELIENGEKFAKKTNVEDTDKEVKDDKGGDSDNVNNPSNKDNKKKDDTTSNIQKLSNILRGENTDLFSVKRKEDEEDFVFITTPTVSASQSINYDEDKLLNEDETNNETSNRTIVTVVHVTNNGINVDVGKEELNLSKKEIENEINSIKNIKRNKPEEKETVVNQYENAIDNKVENLNFKDFIKSFTENHKIDNSQQVSSYTDFINDKTGKTGFIRKLKNAFIELFTDAINSIRNWFRKIFNGKTNLEVKINEEKDTLSIGEAINSGYKEIIETGSSEEVEVNNIEILENTPEVKKDDSAIEKLNNDLSAVNTTLKFNKFYSDSTGEYYLAIIHDELCVFIKKDGKYYFIGKASEVFNTQITLNPNNSENPKALPQEATSENSGSVSTSYNIEYSKLFNLAESFMGTLSYLKVHRNININSEDSYYVLSENAWGDGSMRNPIEFLKNRLNESYKFKSYDDFVNYAKSSVSINFIPVNEEEYKTSLPYNRYQMLTESNPLYESLLFVSFNNNEEKTIKNMIKVQDIQKIVG